MLGKFCTGQSKKSKELGKDLGLLPINETARCHLDTEVISECSGLFPGPSHISLIVAYNFPVD